MSPYIKIEDQANETKPDPRSRRKIICPNYSSEALRVTNG